MLICFTGIDGSGKSMQARRLVERFNAAGHAAVYVWGGSYSSLTQPLTHLGQRLLGAPITWRDRPSPLTRQLTRVGRRLLKVPAQPQMAGAAPPSAPAIGAQYRAYLSATRRIFRWRLLRSLWLQISLIEHASEIWRIVLPHLLRNRIIVCDRYIYDSIISVAVLAGVDAAELPRLLRIPPLYRVPRPEKWFFLDVPAHVAFERKDDIPDRLFVECREQLYRTAAATLGMQVVDGTAAPDVIAEIIWQSVQPLCAQVARARGRA